MTLYGAIQWFDGTTTHTLHVGDGSTIPPPVTTANYDWTDQAPSWAYTPGTTPWTADIPAGSSIVDLQTGSTDFWTNLNNTVTAAGRRVIVRLPAGTFHLKSFRLIGGSGDVHYAFGFWFANLQGFIGAGPDQTFIQMDANSMSAAQLSAFNNSRYSWTAFNPVQMGFCRLDGTAASPIYNGGVCFQAADQQTSWTPYPDVPITTPTPAPHQGVVFYPDSYAVNSYVRFQGTGRALTARPPFEMGTVNSQRGHIVYKHCDHDGRRAASIDATQPRRCTPNLWNNEVDCQAFDTRYHHSNTGRFAVNDQNTNTAALSTKYVLTRCKADHITDVTITGVQQENLSLFGFESTNADITFNDCVFEQDNPKTTPGISQHIEITYVGTRNPSGGKMTINRGIFRNPGFPSIDGYRTMRIVSDTQWYISGLANTIFMYDDAGVRLQPYIYTGTWPPPASTLASAGVSPRTHYLVRPS